MSDGDVEVTRTTSGLLIEFPNGRRYTIKDQPAALDRVAPAVRDDRRVGKQRETIAVPPLEQPHAVPAVDSKTEALAIEIYRACCLMEDDWPEDDEVTDDDWLTLTIHEDRERYRALARAALDRMEGLPNA